MHMDCHGRKRSGTGCIQGTPSVASGSTTYTIKAQNCSGSVETVLHLAVQRPPPTSLEYPSLPGAAAIILTQGELVDRCDIRPEHVQADEVAGADCDSQHLDHGNGTAAVAEVAVAKACAAPPRAEPVAVRRNFAVSEPVAVRRNFAVSEPVAVRRNFAVSSHVVAKGQPHTPSIQSVKFQTPTSSWRTCEAMEPARMRIVKPSTGVSSTSRAAVVTSQPMSQNVWKPEFVKRPLAPSRVCRYTGEAARDSATVSLGGIVGTIPPSLERKWQSTGLAREPIAVPQVPPAAVELGSQRCYAFLTQESPTLAYRPVACS